MKHLRLFKEGFDRKGYYKEIGSDEYWSLYYNSGTTAFDICANKEVFSKREAKWLEDNLNVDEWDGLDGFSDSYERCFSVIFNERSYRITKFKDDWYTLGISIDQYLFWYKCDQFDGLIALLKDKEIIL